MKLHLDASGDTEVSCLLDDPLAKHHYLECQFINWMKNLEIVLNSNKESCMDGMTGQC